jgi:hypothetical protein
MADGLFNASSVYQLLLENNMVPRIIDASPYGMMGSGLFNPKTNVTVARDPSKALSVAGKQSRTETLAHEFTHAAQENLLAPALARINSKITLKEPVSKEERQFLEGMNKLMTENKSWKDLLQRFYVPTGNAEFDKYRTEPIELQAWGVGNMTRPYDKMSDQKYSKNVNPHLNPSMATEFSILAELYSKLPKDTKDISKQNRAYEIEKGRAKDLRGYYKESSDIFSDPFKSTIR